MFDEAYRAIMLFYEDKRAIRSGVRYMNHIDEGLKVMRDLNASTASMEAYCIHPIVQATDDLVKELNGYSYLRDVDPHVIMLAMEYRSTANMYLSYKVNKLTAWEREVIHRRLDVIPGLKDCLIADKVQNYKDFELYHEHTHERSGELYLYFGDWVHEILGVDGRKYEYLKSVMKKRSNTWKQKLWSQVKSVKLMMQTKR